MLNNIHFGAQNAYVNTAAGCPSRWKSAPGEVLCDKLEMEHIISQIVKEKRNKKLFFLFYL